jgi:hypothetical protein
MRTPASAKPTIAQTGKLVGPAATVAAAGPRGFVFEVTAVVGEMVVGGREVVVCGVVEVEVVRRGRLVFGRGTIELVVVCGVVSCVVVIGVVETDVVAVSVSVVVVVVVVAVAVVSVVSNDAALTVPLDAAYPPAPRSAAASAPAAMRCTRTPSTYPDRRGRNRGKLRRCRRSCSSATARPSGAGTGATPDERTSR